MPRIYLETFIAAPRETVFNLSRNIDLHIISTQHTKEEAIAGVTSGLIGPGEEVTWRAKHFGIYQKLTSKITAFEFPDFFVDEMVRGAFKKFRHLHHFIAKDEGTLMIDTFDYTSPWSILGRCTDVLFLKKYMTQLLRKRNSVIKEYAESNKLPQTSDT